MEKKISELKVVANTIRKDIIRSLAEAGSGHSAGSLGMTDVFTALYFSIMRHNPKKPYWKDRDRLILSNGHIVPVLYAALANAGYFPKKELMTLRKIGSRLQGHPHIYSAPGIENSAGPLGQGLSLACGVALAGKMDKKKYKVYCSTSDGEVNEGQAWEAFMSAAKYKLDNLICFMDRNNIQISGTSDSVMPLEPLKDKFKAFGWNVSEINGHDFNQILKTFKNTKKGKPTMILCKTIPGKGVSFIEGRYEWHGKAPSKEEAEKALKELENE